MKVLIVVIAVPALWLLWRIARNTGDALDRCAAIQVELAALNRRLRVVEKAMAENGSAAGQDSQE